MRSNRLPGICNIITILATLSLTGFDTYGQATAEKQIPEWLQKEVTKVTTVIPDLTEEQKAKLAAGIQTRVDDLAKVKNLKEGGASEDEVKSKTNEAWITYNHDAKTFLTDEQFEKFKELHKPKSTAPEQ
jgi:hypothetical protein